MKKVLIMIQRKSATLLSFGLLLVWCVVLHCDAFVAGGATLLFRPPNIGYSSSAATSLTRRSITSSSNNNGETPSIIPSNNGVAMADNTTSTSTTATQINGQSMPLATITKSNNNNKDNPQPTALFYDKTSDIAFNKRRKKEQEIKDRKVAIYHNILQKNANDCSVCTVPDKIDASKIAAPKKNHTNGVTPTVTLEKQLRDLKAQVNQLVQEPSIELTEGLLILASSFMVALTTVSILPPSIMTTVYVLQDATLFVFAFGFLTRWLSSLAPRGTYFNDPLEWVDLLVVVLPFLFLTIPGLADLFPSWLTSQTALINLRLLRILRFQRILQDEFTFSRFVSGLKIPFFSQDNDALSCVIVESWQLQLARVVISISTLLLVSSGLIYSAEHTVNPDIDNYFTALYFGLTTLTTVGFGDIEPITWQGKLVVSGSILAGVAVIPAQAGALVEALLARNADFSPSTTTTTSYAKRPPPPPASMGKNLELETTKTCPSCNAGLHWAQANFCYNCGQKIFLHQ